MQTSKEIFLLQFDKDCGMNEKIIFLVQCNPTSLLFFKKMLYYLRVSFWFILLTKGKLIHKEAHIYNVEISLTK